MEELNLNLETKVIRSHTLNFDKNDILNFVLKNNLSKEFNSLKPLLESIGEVKTVLINKNNIENLAIYCCEYRFIFYLKNILTDFPSLKQIVIQKSRTKNPIKSFSEIVELLKPTFGNLLYTDKENNIRLKNQNKNVESLNKKFKESGENKIAVGDKANFDKVYVVVKGTPMSEHKLVYLPYKIEERKYFTKTNTDTQRDIYYSTRNCCPKCSSNKIQQTLAGFVFYDIETYQDKNSVTCLECGHKTIVHNLV